MIQDHIDGPLLLDTCAVLYLSSGTRLAPALAEAIEGKAASGDVFMSAISAWELGNLASRGRIVLSTDPLEFVSAFVAGLGVTVVDLSPEVLVRSSYLPGRPHKDPMDRILIATARKLNMPLLTSDGAILAYGAEGHVKTVAC